MTPKEKAKELVNKYWGKGITNDKEIAKQCALIAVDEIIKQNVSTPNDYGASWTYLFGLFNESWMQVKQEIEKL